MRQSLKEHVWKLELGVRAPFRVLEHEGHLDCLSVSEAGSEAWWWQEEQPGLPAHLLSRGRGA